MKIEKVHIKGFRNFDDVVVELGEKTLIFGPNDSGKTNFLHALRILFDPGLSVRDFELTTSDFNCRTNPDRVEIAATLCDVREDCLISVSEVIWTKAELLLVIPATEKGTISS